MPVFDTDNPYEKISVLYDEINKILGKMKSKKSDEIKLKLNELLGVLNKDLYSEKEILAGVYENLHASGEVYFEPGKWWNDDHADELAELCFQANIKGTAAQSESVFICIDQLKTGELESYPHNPFWKNESDDK